jgi:galactose mutarotase-like enzyme
MKISGKMREAAVFGENLVLSREIICRYGENRITIRNHVENLGFRDEALMLLFHFNIGYPLLDADSRLIIPSEEVIPRDEDAAKGAADYFRCQKPTSDYHEQVFYHQLKADENGNTGVAIVNETLDMTLFIRFNKNQFFNFTQWKQMGEGEYVMGLEPCNCYVAGRTDPRNEGRLDVLKPGESRDFDITVEILTGEEKNQ